MIVAVLMRNYKCYENLYFTPVCGTPDFPYTTYIGPNGVGKSAILESIDAFFDNRDWNINKKAKKEDAFVAPVFFVRKDKLPVSGKAKSLIEYVSDYFWSITDALHPQLKSNDFKRFFEFRDELKAKYGTDGYYFFIVGKEYSSKARPYFSTFNADLFEKMRGEGYSEDDTKGLFRVVENNFSYIYLPVEGYVEDVLCLEAEEMKELMSKDILNEIDTVLNSNQLTNNGKTTSVVKWINESLNEFMEEINKTISGVDHDYSFKVDGNYKKNVTAQDVRDRIIDAYFAIRTLKKNKKEVGDLSSGEQRKALIDIAYAFLSQRKEGAKNIVIAIDEPEVSLNVAACLPQFDRLYELVGMGAVQVIITTHWYGYLPAMQQGALTYVGVDDGVAFTSFNMPSLYDQRRSFPDDIALKSVFDFVSAVLSLARNDKVKVLIVEGIEDYYYLKSHIPKEGVRIIPVGGAGNVVKIYRYLLPAFEDDREAGWILGEISCLIDTDNEAIPFADKTEDKNGKIKLRRLQYGSNGVILAKPGKGGEYNKTVIEDVVDATLFFTAVSVVIGDSGGDYGKEVIGLYTKRADASLSLVNYEQSVFVPNDVEGYRRFSELRLLLEKFKKEIAKEYASISDSLGSQKLAWMDEL